MSNGIANCLIWGNDYRAPGSWNDSHTIATVKSARAGGKAYTYRITDDALDWLEEKDDRWKALLTTWRIDRRTQGEKEPVVTTERDHPLDACPEETRLKLIDAKHVQFTVMENLPTAMSGTQAGKNNRRPDVVLFVSSLPLGVIEFVNPADEAACGPEGNVCPG